MPGGCFDNTDQQPQAIQDRINEVADGIIGVQMALLEARRTLGDANLRDFLDKVPEKGEELWKRFRALQEKNGDWITFNHLIALVIAR